MLLAVTGVYVSFLTWALVQEPLNTKVWSNSGEKLQAPSVIAIVQAGVAMVVGVVYMRWKKLNYKPWSFISDYKKELALISFTQSTSTPLATYSLHWVDYLTYMLAKSCKMIPILLVHLILYRTTIPRQMRLVAVVVSVGVAVFTLGGSTNKAIANDSDDKRQLSGFLLLGLSLFLDGMTNATQDRLLKNNRLEGNGKTITGAHLMFALNLFIILWNVGYLGVIDYEQWKKAKSMLYMDPQIVNYLLTYAACGALGQCFIFYTLEKYGSLVLVMITVTRKMMSMLLSIIVFGKKVNLVQWLGIVIVFSGILFEAICKRNKQNLKPKNKSE